MMIHRAWNNSGKADWRVACVIAIACLICVSLPLTLNSQSTPSAPTLLLGQSATVLADGRWLLLGGESLGGGINEASIWNPQTGTTTDLTARLKQGRAWHSATVLPDGTVFVFGGIGGNNQIADGAELFDPGNSTFSEVSTGELSPRARHTATLLTNAQVLIAGGVDSPGEPLATADLWYTLDNSTSHVPIFTTARRNHSATLMPNGGVLLWGGLDANGAVVNSGEVFDPTSGEFASVPSYPTTDFPQATDAPILEASLPAHQSIDVPIDSIISLRLSKSLKAETINTNSITLSGPKAIEKIKVVAAENGSLVFVTPEVDLLPGVTYTLTINGAVDRNGLLLPVSGISFSTKAVQELGSSSTAGRLQLVSPDSTLSSLDEDLEWWGRRKDGKPHSDWRDLPPLKADPGVTALAGQVLDLKGKPLARVLMQIEAHYGSETKTVRTDETGRFLLKKIESGWSELIIDGREARCRRNDHSADLGSREDHGVFEYGSKLKKARQTSCHSLYGFPKLIRSMLDGFLHRRLLRS